MESWLEVHESLFPLDLENNVPEIDDKRTLNGLCKNVETQKKQPWQGDVEWGGSYVSICR